MSNKKRAKHITFTTHNPYEIYRYHINYTVRTLNLLCTASLSSMESIAPATDPDAYLYYYDVLTVSRISHFVAIFFLLLSSADDEKCFNLAASNTKLWDDDGRMNLCAQLPENEVNRISVWLKKIYHFGFALMRNIRRKSNFFNPLI